MTRRRSALPGLLGIASALLTCVVARAAEPDAAFRERITGAWDLVFDSDPTVKGAGIDGMSIPAIGARVWRQSR